LKQRPQSDLFNLGHSYGWAVGKRRATNDVPWRNHSSARRERDSESP